MAANAQIRPVARLTTFTLFIRHGPVISCQWSSLSGRIQQKTNFSSRVQFCENRMIIWSQSMIWSDSLVHTILNVSRPKSRTSNNAVSPGPTVGRLLCATTRPTVGHVHHRNKRLTVRSPLTVTSGSESRTSDYGNYTSNSRLYAYSIVSFFLFFTALSTYC